MHLLSKMGKRINKATHSHRQFIKEEKGTVAIGDKSGSESHSVVSASVNSAGQDTGVGSLSLLQGIFPTQGLNPGLWHCRYILYQLSHKRSPRILEWVVYPFSRGSF